MVAYRGKCQVRRAEILRLKGAWGEAGRAAEQACARYLEGPARPAAGAAFYEKAEVLRLCGALDHAEAAYRQAARWGRKPQPGLSQLRMYQGQPEAAAVAIRGALSEVHDRVGRARLLPVFVEVMLAVDDLPAARAAVDELAGLAADLEGPFLKAAAAQALGALRLAEGEAASALHPLRRAWAGWQEAGAPYEAARVRVLVGLACRALGDEDTASVEFEAARDAFRKLGAKPDLQRMEQSVPSAPPAGAAELTPRQVEVLRLIATGKTNREVAAALYISEKTVARHMSNILARLDLPNRAAATAYVYKHGLM
jgi:DNA-binding CsgD family transcriptional regulator